MINKENKYFVYEQNLQEIYRKKFAGFYLDLMKFFLGALVAFSCNTVFSKQQSFFAACFCVLAGFAVYTFYIRFLIPNIQKILMLHINEYNRVVDKTYDETPSTTRQNEKPLI